MIDLLSVDDEVTWTRNGNQSYQGHHWKYGRVFDVSWGNSHSYNQEREFADLSKRYSGKEIILSRVSEES